MTKYLSIAILITGFLVGNAYGDDLIADVHFDDGSILHNANLKSSRYSKEIKVKYEKEIFILNFEDLKTLELVKIERGKVIQGSYLNDFESIGEEAIVTLKIKTKTGIVINDRFSASNMYREGRYIPCKKGFVFSFTNKLTGKEITKTYPMLAITVSGPFEQCVFTDERETKAIISIVFKD
jgi:hypothetical protein